MKITKDSVSGDAGSAPVSGADDARGSFQADISPRDPGRALREYWSRLRGGDPGALPAVLGLVVLAFIFSRVSTRFLGESNLGNLPGQASFYALIALGLVFVLLLGEIDLAAGTTGAVCAAFAAESLNKGSLSKAEPGFLFWGVIIVMLGALTVAILNRIWISPLFVLAGLLMIVTGGDGHEIGALIMAVGIGVAIGTLMGVLIARVGIPSFIATLALFLTFQGVLLFALNSQSVDITRYNLWYGLAHNNMAVFWGWALYAFLVVSYLAVTLIRSLRRRAAGLAADTLALVLIRAVVIAALGAVVVEFLSQNRNPNVGLVIEGVPWALSIPIVLMIVWTIVLSKSTWGRHLYAVGGNSEAANRAGINVDRMKVSAFAISSGMAALGGVFLSSKTGGVQLDLGQGDTLLFAVAAAVIGGTSLFGGRGKARDAIIGAYIIAIIPNGIGLRTSLPPQYNEVITGAVLLLAASVDALARRRARSRS